MSYDNIERKKERDRLFQDKNKFDRSRLHFVNINYKYYRFLDVICISNDFNKSNHEAAYFVISILFVHL